MGRRPRRRPCVPPALAAALGALALAALLGPGLPGTARGAAASGTGCPHPWADVRVGEWASYRLEGPTRSARVRLQVEKVTEEGVTLLVETAEADGRGRHVVLLPRRIPLERVASTLVRVLGLEREGLAPDTLTLLPSPVATFAGIERGFVVTAVWRGRLREFGGLPSVRRAVLRLAAGVPGLGLVGLDVTDTTSLPGHSFLETVRLRFLEGGGPEEEPRL